MFGYIDKLVSAIYNDIVSGLRGFHINSSISKELLALDIIDERLLIIKEYSLKGILPIKDLLLSINCILVDCKSLERCRCKLDECNLLVAHFLIPLVVNDYGGLAIDYIGSVDRLLPFIFYTSTLSLNYHKYRKRGKNRPYVWIDTTPNENNMYDCFIFNAPLIKEVSVVAVFKDPRQLEEFGCCDLLNDDNQSFINNEIKRRLTYKKISYYRLLAAALLPNDLSYLP